MSSAREGKSADRDDHVASAFVLGDAFHAALYESAPYAVMVSTMPDGIIRSVNPAFERLFGFTADEVIGRTSLESGLSDPATRSRVYEEFARNGCVRAFETTRTRRSGDVGTFSLHLDEVVVGDRTFWVTTLIDVTDQRRAEADRERLGKELAAAQKMEAIGTLAGGVAHDFNNILAGILGGLSLLESELGASARARTELGELKALATRGADLAKQLVGFARLGRYDARALNLAEAVDEAKASFARARPGIKVVVEMPRHLRPVLMDPVQLLQVLTNLFENAGAAMPEGGRIVVRAENVEPSPPAAADVLEANALPRPRVRLVVTDTGSGMDGATLARVFEPFFTTRGAGGGRGLGLAAVHGIVLHHGGSIDAASEVGVGSTFTLTLPTAEPQSASIPPTMATGSAPGRSTVLVVDDEKAMLRICRRIFENAGFDVLVAERGEHAIELLREHGARVVLVVLDMTMPGLGGARTFDAMHALRPDLKVLLASGFGSEGEARDILARGCNGFIQKPFSSEELVEKARSLL